MNRLAQSRADRERIAELWADGASIYEIADALGTTKQNATNRMRKMRDAGWTLPYRHNRTKHPHLRTVPLGMFRCPRCCRVVRRKRTERICKPCRRRYESEWAKGQAERFRAKNRRIREEHPEKYRAWNAVKVALGTGKLVKPDACERCGQVARRIDGHHADYSKPLEVEWLCPQCHSDHHWNEKAAASSERPAA